MSDTTAGSQTLYPPPQPFERIGPPPRPRPTLPIISGMQLLWIVAAAFLANVALRTGLGTVASFVAVAIVVGPLLGATFKRSRVSAVFAGAAVLFAAWLPLRASSWLIALNTLAVIAALIAAACTLHPLQLRLDLRTVRTVLSRLLLFRFFGFLLTAAARPLQALRGGRLLPLMRGVALAVLPVVILGALLASADAVFAKQFQTDLNPAGLLGHVVLSAFAFLAIVALIAITSEPIEESFENNKPLGSTEALIVLVSVAALYSGFAIVQLVGAVGNVDDILTAQGLTYAEYARSGFFQLLWVAGLTIVLLGLVRLLVADGNRTIDNAVRVTGALVALLTILIVAVAINRLGLYTDAFGQTTLRWYCTAFAWMLGAVFVVLAIGQSRHCERYIPITVMTIIALTLLSVNIVNPEARVAQHNLERDDPFLKLDADYLTLLSADAWPELINDWDVLQNQPRLSTEDIVWRCLEASEQSGYGPLGFSLAKSTLSCPDIGG